MDFALVQETSMVLFACHDDRRLDSFSIKNTPMVLDTITNGIIYEPLARIDDYLKRLSLGSRLKSILLTHRS